MNSNKKQTKKKRQSNFLYDFVRVTGAIPMMLYLRVKKYRVGENAPKKLKGNAVVIGNHNSFLDPVIAHVAFWYRRLYCLATKDLFASKLKNWFFGKMNCIKVDKQNFSVGALHSVCDRLKEGKVALVFPEGRVVHGEEEIKQFKSGAILMAHIGGAPIIPTYIVKPNRWYKRTKVLIGEPFDVSAILGKIPTLAQIEKASEILHEKEEQLATYYNEKIRKQG